MSVLPKRYVSTGKSAKGGFGEVLFCIDSHLKRTVAIKFLHDLDEIRRSYDELKALLQLRSKHIVQVYDLVKCDDGSIGIVEEFVNGDDLWQSQYPNSSIDNFLKTLWQIASGISDIHSANIIHRDIKPNNMKLDPEGLVKIYDFGLARNTGEAAKTKGFKGTFGFAAPELLSGEEVNFTSAIDVYAFGASVFVLAGEVIPPCLMQVPPVLPAPGFFSGLLGGLLPIELSGLLEKCLATNPNDRPDMDSLRAELARYLLKDKHQAIAVISGKPSYLNSSSRKVGLKFGEIGSIEITYDGLYFTATVATGEIYINNRKVVVGDVIPSSCVVVFGISTRPRNERAIFTFDISNPEVVL